MKNWMITYIDGHNKTINLFVAAVNRPKAVAQLKHILPENEYKRIVIVDCNQVNQG